MEAQNKTQKTKSSFVTDIPSSNFINELWTALFPLWKYHCYGLNFQFLVTSVKVKSEDTQHVSCTMIFFRKSSIRTYKSIFLNFSYFLFYSLCVNVYRLSSLCELKELGHFLRQCLSCLFKICLYPVNISAIEYIFDFKCLSIHLP